MCGIAGIVGTGYSEQVLSGFIQRMNAAMKHRGPDGEGCFVEAGNALGHVRLSIIDLSDAGRQPMCNEDESIWISVNGEIYNYKVLRAELKSRGHTFRSHSDSEVVLHLYEEYGEDFPEHLDGMFAISLWDSRKKKLMLVRDRFGIKPLYYSRQSQSMIFASELSALMAPSLVAREYDDLAMYGYMAFGYVPAPKSIYKNVMKLKPAECLVFEGGQSRLWRYWKPQQVKVGKSYAVAVDELQTLLAKSVSEQLVSDVPVATFLSGGVDSSLVTALASKTRRMDSLCAAFPGSTVDESQIAADVATHLGSNHQEIRLGLDPAALFTASLRYLDEPFADSSAMPTYAICEAGRLSAKVILSGDGGDEAFGGYTGRYRVAALKALVPAPAAVAKWLRCLPPWRSGRRSSLPLMLELAALDETERYVRERELTTEQQRRLLFTPEAVEEGEAWLRQIASTALQDCPYEHPVHRALWVDLCTSLPDDMLTKVDRMSMANGLEVRVPLLNQQLVEYSLSCPPRWLVSIRAIEGKRLLRSVAEPLLPPDILERPKQGFSVPLDEWLQTPLQSLWNPGNRQAVSEILDIQAFENGEALPPQGRSREDLYALLLLANWLQKEGDKSNVMEVADAHRT